MSGKENINVILMTGITNTVSSDGQAQLFLDGYGEDEGLLYFGHTEIQKLLSSLIKYPNAPIVLYSAAGKYAPQVAKAVNDKSKIFVIEPWVANDNRLKGAINAIASGIPSTNYQIGPKDYRGDGIPNASQTPVGLDHFQALTYAGQVIRSKYPPPPPEPPTQPISFIGKVIDASTKEVLPGVNISINQNGTFTGKGLTTDFDGLISSSYDLTVGTYDFEISYTGYVNSSLTKQVLATTKEINFNTIELSEDDKLLEEVEVLAESFIGTIIDKNSKNPIPGATILSDTNTKDKATSQTDGTFSLNIQFDEEKFEIQKELNDKEINELITPGDVIDAQDAGIIPDGTYTLQGNEVILQNKEIYEWLKSKGDPRVPNTKERKIKQITAIASAQNYSQSNPIQLIKGDGSFRIY